jgi:hypothetical protein
MMMLFLRGTNTHLTVWPENGDFHLEALLNEDAGFAFTKGLIEDAERCFNRARVSFRRD